MSRTVSDVIIETLIDLGIKRIYGLPGDSLNPLVDSIRRHDDKIEFIQVRHEEGAALAASFESKLTGKVTVCMGTSGPGSIHLLNGLYDAKMDHASVIALTGQVETDLIGTDYFQEVKLDSLFADVSVYSTTIMSPERSQSLVLRAHREALMRKGVSHLILPADVLRLQSNEPENITEDFYPILKFNPDLQKVNDAINRSKKPVILIGKGARGCGLAIDALSEKIGAPIIYALNGKGIVDDLDRKVMGSLGLLGTRPSYDAMKHADLLIMIGSSYPYIQFIPYVTVKFPDTEKKKIDVVMDEKTSGNVRTMKYLFSMDALGGGLVNTAILSLWFKYVYNITLSEAGIIFLIVNIVTAFSILLSSKLSNRMGVVRTMVYTHLVSNVFLILIPVYHSLIISEIFLFLRQTTSQMDVPARDSFTNTIIPGEYRIKANSVFNSVRTGFQVPGPLISSVLIDALPATVFYSAGLIKMGYDLLFFKKYRDFRDA